MWLLETSSLKLHSFLDDSQRPYFVILSHTWTEKETSFQEIQGPHDSIENKAGYFKVKQCCAKAASDGFQYVWIDTCCIDKTNSAELSEAINSMFKWYQDAMKCYAYLEDVDLSRNSEAEETQFKAGRWFTRGWTLQELLAPATVVFLDHNWLEIGRKKGLKNIISEVTGIPAPVLESSESIETASVAQKMSWAAKRQTTRVEDLAYCLMGIFDISMPLVYGEGAKAFTRLQLEIMKVSADHSLFAWTIPVAATGLSSGPLAMSPLDFHDCATITTIPEGKYLALGTLPLSYEMTNRGLRSEYFWKYVIPYSPAFLFRGSDVFTVSLPLADTKDSTKKIALLNIRREEHPTVMLGVCLYRIGVSTYVRQDPESLVKIENLDSFETSTLDKKPIHTTIYLAEPPPSHVSYQKMKSHHPITVSIECNPKWDNELSLAGNVSPYPSGTFQRNHPYIWTVKYGSGVIGFLYDRTDNRGRCAVILRLLEGRLWGTIIPTFADHLDLVNEVKTLNCSPDTSPKSFVSVVTGPTRKINRWQSNLGKTKLWRAGDHYDPIKTTLLGGMEAEVHISPDLLNFQKGFKVILTLVEQQEGYSRGAF